MTAPENMLGEEGERRDDFYEWGLPEAKWNFPSMWI